MHDRGQHGVWRSGRPLDADGRCRIEEAKPLLALNLNMLRVVIKAAGAPLLSYLLLWLVGVGDFIIETPDGSELADPARVLPDKVRQLPVR